MKHKYIYIALALFVALTRAHAVNILLGEMQLTGDFTQNPAYFDNFPRNNPYGTFGTMTVQSANGIFVPDVSTGDTLSMNSTHLNTIEGSPPLPIPLMSWTMDGFKFDTFNADLGVDGMFVFGEFNLSGNGFDPAVFSTFPFQGVASFWSFESPPLGMTGPITMTIDTFTSIPENADTAVLMLIGLGAIVFTPAMDFAKPWKQASKDVS